ncbi:MAG: hypothetical protein AABY22_31785 [Nanoarchaeota archaeon]
MKKIMQLESKVNRHRNSGVFSVQSINLKRFIGKKLIVQVFTK